MGETDTRAAAERSGSAPGRVTGNVVDVADRPVPDATVVALLGGGHDEVVAPGANAGGPDWDFTVAQADATTNESGAFSIRVDETVYVDEEARSDRDSKPQRLVLFATRRGHSSVPTRETSVWFGTVYDTFEGRPGGTYRIPLDSERIFLEDVRYHRAAIWRRIDASAEGTADAPAGIGPTGEASARTAQSLFASVRDRQLSTEITGTRTPATGNQMVNNLTNLNAGILTAQIPEPVAVRYPDDDSNFRQLSKDGIPLHLQWVPPDSTEENPNNPWENREHEFAITLGTELASEAVPTTVPVFAAVADGGPTPFRPYAPDESGDDTESEQLSDFEKDVQVAVKSLIGHYSKVATVLFTVTSQLSGGGGGEDPDEPPVVERIGNQAAVGPNPNHDDLLPLPWKHEGYAFVHRTPLRFPDDDTPHRFAVRGHWQASDGTRTALDHGFEVNPTVVSPLPAKHPPNGGGSA